MPFSLSTVGVCTLEEVSRAAAPPWFQLYMTKDRGFMAELLARAQELGSPVLLFTVDLPMPGARYKDTRNAMIPVDRAGAVQQALDGLAHPAWLWDVFLQGRPHSLGNVAAAAGDMKGIGDFWRWVGRNFDPSVSWKDIEWVRARWDGPIVLKGILDVEDAREATRTGVEGIVVSNHGGRQLDGAPSSISALPAIADAVGDELTVLMDGGVRSGLDVLKALALGARACLIGRAWAWALGGGGEKGVAHMLSIVRQEMQMAMALTGCTRIADANRQMLI